MKIGIPLILILILSTSCYFSVLAQDKQTVELVVQTGHAGEVTAVAFSPNEEILASGSDDRTIKLLDTNSGQELKTLIGHTSLIRVVAFSPNGNVLASGSSDKIVKLWDVALGKELRTLPESDSTIYALAFSKDGKTLASGNGTGTVDLWDIDSGRKIKTFAGDRAVYSIVFLPDKKNLAVGGAGGEVELCNIFTGTRVKTLSAPILGWAYSQSVALSPDGRRLACGDDKTVGLWDVSSGRKIETSATNIESAFSVAFSPEGKILASGSKDRITLFDTEKGHLLKVFTSGIYITSLAFSPKGNRLSAGDTRGSISLWDVTLEKESRVFPARTDWILANAFSPDGKMIASGNSDGTVKLWSFGTTTTLKTLSGHRYWTAAVAFSPNGNLLASSSFDGSIILWNTFTGARVSTISKTFPSPAIAFSPDGEHLAFGNDKSISLWDVKTGTVTKNLAGYKDQIYSLTFSRNGTKLASGSENGEIKLWDVNSGLVLITLNPLPDIEEEVLPPGVGRATGVGTGKDIIRSIVFSPDTALLASASDDNKIKLWDTRTGQKIKTFEKDSPDLFREITVYIPDFFRDYSSAPMTVDRRFQIKQAEIGKSCVYETGTGKQLATLIALDKDDWVVTTSEGRFDTNRSFDQIERLHWIVNDEIRKPLPLDIFMRQYYEPGLLARVIAGEKLKALPSIADINRVQPRVVIKRISSSPNSTDSVDITLDVENVTENISISAMDKTKKRQISSGVFDLRLFRDGQLVGISTPRDKLAAFIDDAPRLIAETKASGKLIDTPEDRAWREASDIFKLKSENIKVISPEKVQYTFRNIKLPHDGRKEVEFTAYAFNSDRVKSTTTDPFKFAVPTTLANSPKKGRAFLVSIGVNASENPAYNLRYAVNDARKMQETVGARLEVDDKYSEVIQIPLISDHDLNLTPTENTAQKAIIKGVFSLLAGHKQEVPADVLQRIPNHDKIKPVEPEDTLIITYSGHGYAEQSGIFYLLPYDIGAVTTELTPKALKNMISSDEISLWMLDITAAEMIMIIDACHSAAAVQGDGFKPAPMGSRGLGQLAYDKNMKILSATQADNVALELNSLEQGLLSYALIEDGIRNALADSDKNKQLSATEWLSFGEARVPQLYQEIRDGKRGVIIDGRRRDTLDSDFKLQGNLKLQRPHLFDFRRNSSKMALFTLP